MVEYIKNSLKINSYDFENYSRYNQNIKLNFEDLLSEQFLTYLLNLSHIKDIPDNRTKGKSRNRTKARRCLEVIVFALLNSTDYNDLKSKLIKYTDLTDRQVINNIKEYMPLLNFFNPNLNMSNWLPEVKIPITYNDILNIIAPYGHIIKTSEKEFYERIQKDETWASLTFFELICHDCNKSFFSCYHYFKWNQHISNRCPHCAGNAPISYIDLKQAIENKKGTLITTPEEFELNKEIENSNPSKTKVEIVCENNHTFISCWNSIVHLDNWCSSCSGNKRMTFQEIKDYAISLGYSVLSNEQEFNNRRIRDNTVPSFTKIALECKKKHIWNANYIHFTRYFCPHCNKWKNESIVRWYLNKIFNYINSQCSHFPSIFFSGCYLKDLRILDNSSLYTGQLKYDGYSQINCSSDFVLKIPSIQFQNRKIYKLIYKITIFDKLNFTNFLVTFNHDFNNSFSNNDRLLISLPFGEIELIIEDGNLKLLNSSLFFPNYEICNLNVLKIAFEHDGYQHYIFPNIFHNSLSKFLSQIIGDLYKKKLSFENNIILLDFPYYINIKMNDPKKIQDYLIKRLGEFTNINFSKYKIPQFNHLSKDAFKDILSYQYNEE